MLKKYNFVFAIFLIVATHSSGAYSQAGEMEEVIVTGRQYAVQSLPPDYYQVDLDTASVQMSPFGVPSPAQEAQCYERVNSMVEQCKITHSTSQGLSCSIATSSVATLMTAGVAHISFRTFAVAAVPVTVPVAATAIAASLVVTSAGHVASAMCQQSAAAEALDYCENEARDAFVQACTNRGAAH